MDEAQVFEMMNKYGISDVVIESLDLYVKQGIPTGDFLKAVLSNDLMEAVGRADHWNQKTLVNICGYIYNELPKDCWGSPARVANWLDSFRKVN